MKKIIAFVLMGIFLSFLVACAIDSSVVLTESQKKEIAEEVLIDYIEEHYPNTNYQIFPPVANQVDVIILGSLFTGSIENFTATISFSETGKAVVKSFYLK